MFYRCKYTKGHKVHTNRKPTRSQLGMSPSSLKTKLKKLGFSVPKNFFKCSILKLNQRFYRFRWSNTDEVYLVDISCLEEDFDRWANSTEKTVTFQEFLNEQ